MVKLLLLARRIRLYGLGHSGKVSLSLFMTSGFKCCSVFSLPKKWPLLTLAVLPSRMKQTGLLHERIYFIILIVFIGRYVPSEGSLSFVLKTKSAALRDGDNILAVVKSTDVKHGGRSQGLVAPNVHTQIVLQRSLLQKAGMEPSEIDFLETHGTGTSLGDLIEIQGINEVFQHSHSQHRPLVLGAAKSCVGHTELAAGLVGVLKALASFKYGAVPGLMHLTATNMNPAIDCGVVPAHIPHETVSLPPKPGEVPHYGLVLANGFSGTIAGVILEEPTDLSQSSPANGIAENIPMPFVVSAKTVHALRQYLNNYLEFSRKAPPSEFRNICYTTCVGREHYKYRFSCVASNLEELIQKLEEELRSFSPTRDGDTVGRILFAFPGQGSQYQGMASELAIPYPEFKDILTFASATATHLSGYPILSFLMDPTCAIDLEIDDGRLAQICIFVYQYSISVWLRTLGIEPSAVLGHSLGEIAAVVIAGGLTYELGLELVIKRSELLRSDPAHPGGMALIATSKGIITELLRQLGLEGRLVIAVYNGPQSHVLSGELVALDVFLLTAKSKGLRASKLNVVQGFHSPSIYPSLPALQRWLDENHHSSSRLNIPLYSTAYGSKVSGGSRLRPTYWVEHARDPVRFSDAIEDLESDRTIDVVLDVGPQPYIWTTLQSLPHTKLALATSTKKSNNQNVAFLQAIVSLFAAGVAPDFEKLFTRNSFHLKRTIIPTYPFQRQRHFPDFIPSRNIEAIQRSHITKAKPAPENATRAIPFIVDQELYDLLFDHQIEGRRVLPGASLADFFATHTPSKSLKIITFHSPLVIQSPQNGIVGNFDEQGSFSMVQGGLNVAKVCSGIIAPDSNFVMTNFHTNNPPDHVRSKDEVYAGFKSVQFGPSFRNVQEVRAWSTHAEALIAVKASESTGLDRIRKLDSCFHAFGAIAERELPQIREVDGSFLPASLEGFTLHSDDLPDTLVCRYHLPLDVSRNSHLISTSFEVVSLTGELLVSCTKYSVAWIPINVVLQRTELIPAPRIGHWLQQHWTTQKLVIPRDLPNQKLGHLLYIRPQGHDSQLLAAFSSWAEETSTIALPARNGVDDLDAHCATAFEKCNGTSVFAVFDLTSSDDVPTTRESSYYHHGVLRLMKLLSRAKIDIRSLVVISEMSVATQMDLHSSRRFWRSKIQPPGLGSVVQGMLRVFRRETGLDAQLWGLDLPPLGSVGDSVLRDVLLQEIAARQNGLVLDKTVAYRLDERDGLIRMVPSLKIVDYDDHPLQACSGVSIIVGLGSIGSALASALVSNGSTRIVFIGRRNVEDIEVLGALGRLQKEMNGRCDYFQADVCDLDSLRSSFQEIQQYIGPIENIVNTAAVIQDATVQNVQVDSFDAVLRPKVLGAWNLHVISEELCTSLKSFVLLGSIRSVITRFDYAECVFIG
ncbi:hypothetical protein M413DRAFT_372839 [Hebeloma cylindrosporum]|uniref:Carrier domain-containing protein n=1 Tax=Hebeloma cylindrosporum TaxID=76867 RepID=A0A0C3CJQ8_HEBCY|nr:hypothetical protein M413DRAFT_372839 [Hebeloma cylindrosporum h7]